MEELLRNTWYMGAWAYEVTRKPMSRRLLGVNTMFYRKLDGTVVALRDRCPHRFAPLSKGRVIDDQIQCPYHGLIFDSSGQCVGNPLDDSVPRGVKVQAFPVTERDSIVWFWPGDPNKPDTSKIPDFSYLTDQSVHRHVFGLTHVKAHYEVETDNLMDLSHVNMVHPPFSGVLNRTSTYSAGRTGDTIYSNWFTRAGNNPPVMELGPFPTQGVPIDQWLEMRWNAPGSMYLEVAVTRTGADRAAGYTMPSSHLLTPETEATTHYFWSASMRATDPIPIEMFRESFVQAFDNEDKPMIEQVAAEMDSTDLFSLKPLLLKTDRGAVLARRALADMIRGERESIAISEEGRTPTQAPTSQPALTGGV
jgi:phenylpropionate dioxygenase-like ring-hydroxylating dioxygenase large terminal subunit